MASAKGYDHDVFISYATVDDRPANRGWVSMFVSTLNESLRALCDVRDPDRIWWDRSHIDEEAPLTEQIRNTVQKSACMVVILSRAYANSNWCRQERDAFLKAVASQPEADRRLFLIDIGNLDQKDRPQEFSDNRGHHFYFQPLNTTKVTDRLPLGFPTPDPENKDHAKFFEQVNHLATKICDLLGKLSGTTPIIKPNTDVTLFVAEPADDVAEEREQVVRFLSDHFHVLPAIDDPLPNRWDEWLKAVDAGLKASTLFVQVFGTLPGHKIAGSDKKLVNAQFERAKAAGVRIVSWRKTAPEAVVDGQLKELVAAAEYCGPIREFMNEVTRIATPVPQPDASHRRRLVRDRRRTHLSHLASNGLPQRGRP